MQKVIDISLSGHPQPFRLHEDAFNTLGQYLDQARARIADEEDRAEVADDLERSIGEKLSALSPSEAHVFSQNDIDAVLRTVGDVDADVKATPASAPASAPAPTQAMPRRGRRLFRIREGQNFAGVCQGLAVYTDVDVSWVRTIFVLLALVTAGGFLLVYLAMVLILPVVGTREEFLAAQPAMNDAS